MSSEIATSATASTAVGQQHPISLYLKIWALLFILSGCSYAVDYFEFEGYLRWILIITFMWAKAALIIGIFMHMAWERMALIFAILLPPALLLILVGMMTIDGVYTMETRALFFGPGG